MGRRERLRHRRRREGREGRASLVALCSRSPGAGGGRSSRAGHPNLGQVAGIAGGGQIDLQSEVSGAKRQGVRGVRRTSSPGSSAPIPRVRETGAGGCVLESGAGPSASRNPARQFAQPRLFGVWPERRCPLSQGAPSAPPFRPGPGAASPRPYVTGREGPGRAWAFPARE